MSQSSVPTAKSHSSAEQFDFSKEMGLIPDRVVKAECLQLLGCGPETRMLLKRSPASANLMHLEGGTLRLVGAYVDLGYDNIYLILVAFWCLRKTLVSRSFRQVQLVIAAWLASLSHLPSRG